MERLTDKNHKAINTCGAYSSCYACHREICYISELEHRLGELEDVLEKYGIENVEELEQELAELKQKAIVPKYKIGDKVYAIIDTFAYTGVFPVEIRDTHLLYEVWDGEDTTKQHYTRIFATKEEAKQKLAEIRRKDE